VGQTSAREIFFLGRTYTAEGMGQMGAVNAVVPHASLQATALEWATEINGKSPTAQRMLKYAFNLIDDGLVGQQLSAGETTRLAYMTDEAVEGRDAFSWRSGPWTDPLPVLLLSCLPFRRDVRFALGHTAYSNWGFCCMPTTVINSVRLHHTDSSVKVRADRRAGE
jgi:hypothetical protein